MVCIVMSFADNEMGLRELYMPSEIAWITCECFLENKLSAKRFAKEYV